MDHHISASILAADFAHLGDEVNNVLQAGANSIHFDVMDHHFVPNLSFGTPICHSLRQAGIKAPIDVHLMVDLPEQYIEPFAKAGANSISFHPETTNNVQDTIAMIHDAGMQAGLAFNPNNPVDLYPADLENIDLLLMMTVFPGFGGQSFMTEVLPNIRLARELIDTAGTPTTLAVDGGINANTIALAAQAGANYFVVGSALFGTDDYALTIDDLHREITA